MKRSKSAMIENDADSEISDRPRKLPEFQVSSTGLCSGKAQVNKRRRRSSSLSDAAVLYRDIYCKKKSPYLDYMLQCSASTWDTDPSLFQTTSLHNEVPLQSPSVHSHTGNQVDTLEKPPREPQPLKKTRCILPVSMPPPLNRSKSDLGIASTASLLSSESEDDLNASWRRLETLFSRDVRGHDPRGEGKHQRPSTADCSSAQCTTPRLKDMEDMQDDYPSDFGVNESLDSRFTYSMKALKQFSSLPRAACNLMERRLAQRRKERDQRDKDRKNMKPLPLSDSHSVDNCSYEDEDDVCDVAVVAEVGCGANTLSNRAQCRDPGEVLSAVDMLTTGSNVANTDGTTLSGADLIKELQRRLCDAAAVIRHQQSTLVTLKSLSATKPSCNPFRLPSCLKLNDVSSTSGSSSAEASSWITRETAGATAAPRKTSSSGSQIDPGTWGMGSQSKSLASISPSEVSFATALRDRSIQNNKVCGCSNPMGINFLHSVGSGAGNDESVFGLSVFDISSSSCSTAILHNGTETSTIQSKCSNVSSALGNKIVNCPRSACSHLTFNATGSIQVVVRKMITASKLTASKQVNINLVDPGQNSSKQYNNSPDIQRQQFIQRDTVSFRIKHFEKLAQHHSRMQTERDQGVFTASAGNSLEAEGCYQVRKWHSSNAEFPNPAAEESRWQLRRLLSQPKDDSSEGMESEPNVSTPRPGYTTCICTPPAIRSLRPLGSGWSNYWLGPMVVPKRKRSPARL